MVNNLDMVKITDIQGLKDKILNYEHIFAKSEEDRNKEIAYFDEKNKEIFNSYEKQIEEAKEIICDLQKKEQLYSSDFFALQNYIKSNFNVEIKNLESLRIFLIDIEEKN